MEQEKKNRGIIVLDPGHGEFGNPHTTKEGFYEGTQNFILAGFLRDELAARGFEPVMTRNDVTDDPSLAERGELAGKLGAILFLSVHSNAPGGDPLSERYPTIRGAETYYSITDPEENAKLARALNDAVVKTMGTLDRGIKTRRYPDNDNLDYYGVIRASATSGCKRALLVEHGFHTNPEDSAFLQDSGCLAKLAAAEAEVIDAYFTEKGI
jgi:N-acetylmuramoyl-L-alanine amidase